MDKLYRYEDWHYLELSEVELKEYHVISVTPQGVWIKPPFAKKKWVSTVSRGGRFAWPTIQQAWDSYRIRKLQHAKHLATELLRANRLVELVRKQGSTPPQKQPMLLEIPEAA